MATAGIQNATITYFSDGGTQITHLTEITFDMSTDMIDITTKDSGGYREILPGLRSMSGSGTAYYAEDATEGFEEMYANFTGRTAVTLRRTTGVSGDTYIETTAYLSNLSETAGTEDVRSYTFTYEVSAAPTSGTET